MWAWPVQADISTPRGAAKNAVTPHAQKPGAPKVTAPTRRNAATRPTANKAPNKNAAARPPVPGSAQPRVIPRHASPKNPGVYPWRLNITATVFWVGEDASARNPVHNHKSSWDGDWRDNFGGFDNPDPQQRTADYRPKAFIPRQNPFYVALPYNDVSRGKHKPEAARVIPWFRKEFVKEGQSVCKGKWVQIQYNGKYCFAQWEDCGPFTTEDWPYVFGDKTPVNMENKRAGIDISPAVRDYLGIKGGTALVNWRFVEFYRIPRGPWSKWGDNNPFVHPDLKRKAAQQLQQSKNERLRQQQEAIRRELLKNPDKLRRELQGGMY